MSKTRIAVIFGGRSTEHQVSVMSAENVIACLSPEKYTVLPVYITKEGKWLIYEGANTNVSKIQWQKFGTQAVLSPDPTQHGFLRIAGDKVKIIPVDVIFPLIHGINGEDGRLQGLCELSGIPYVGCGVLASSVCMDKVFTKMIAGALGFKQAEFISVKLSENDNLDLLVHQVKTALGYPCFVKPSNTGSSIGITKAGNKKQLIRAIETAAKFDKKIIIEKAVSGRELECSVIGNEKPFASKVGEIVTSSEFYDYDAKYINENSQTIIKPDLPADIEQAVREMSIKLYHAVDASGMARVDFFYDEKSNEIIFNEINTIPGFTNISMYPMLLEVSGFTKSEMIDKLVELSFNK